MSKIEIPNYSMIIQWSPLDGAFVVTIPELPGAQTHGENYEDAARNGREVIALVVEGLAQDGIPIPTSSSFQDVKPVGFQSHRDLNAVRRAS